MKKKGFTLVELLAVIVILAIIAVIAVPIILNVISKSKKGAAIDSAYSYADAIEKYIVMHDMDETKYPVDLKSNETYQVSNTAYTEASSINIIEKVYAEDNIILNDIIKIKGTKPSSGIVTISEKRKVGKAILIIDSYKVICETGKCNIDGEDDVSDDIIEDDPDKIECSSNREWAFKYTGDYQEFKVPSNGTYKIELWGASTCSTCTNGAYVSGNIKLNKDDKFYIYIGEQGSDPIAYSSAPSTYNGGGLGGYGRYSSGQAGGGSTDIRYFGNTIPTDDDLTWNSELGLRSRIIVSAGGGGGDGQWQQNVVPAGGLNGYSSKRSGSDTGVFATQTSGNAFGIGGDGAGTTCSFGCGGHGGGGSGYYGGVGGTGGYGCNCYVDSGGSGSSYISGHTGCVAITSSTDQTPKTGCDTGTTDNTCSVHYSGLKFTNTIMIDGAGYSWTNEKGEQQQMPTTNCGTYDLGVGHTGNGYVRITLIK